MSWPKYGFKENPYKYDVCLSFAGEQRGYVEAVAENLLIEEVRVFYDDFEKVDLWGKNLYDHLSQVYSQAARFCVLFASKEYASKVWTTHERRSAQERAMGENEEYILPVIFDDTKIPGLLSTVSYVDARVTTPEEVAQRLISKIRAAEKIGYVPPNPLALYQTLNISTKEEKEAVLAVAQSFARNFSRATHQERRLFFYLILRACPHGRMSDPHVAIQTLEREFGATLDEVEDTLEKMASLNVSYSFSSYCQGVPSNNALHIRWDSADPFVDPNIRAYARNYSNRIASAMIRAAITHICEDCIEELIVNLDFSNLANDISETLAKDMPEADFLPFLE
ncbi:TIR domain-containing protein [Microtetraspora sp. AC03309]|uniref:toll/interleukin-1 receptor domain-containing protein n=1 Tax=Microtetraspora sp. AC03309 TaxID=2779376 RepID=UPI001E547C56|nr:TIR domain-containing protein [Microtetraspora sp. AC03309]MCC5581866.1 TIR domain-containing protein [Microtetraspora sp. AC03309]